MCFQHLHCFGYGAECSTEVTKASGTGCARVKYRNQWVGYTLHNLPVIFFIFSMKTFYPATSPPAHIFVFKHRECCRFTNNMHTLCSIIICKNSSNTTAATREHTRPSESVMVPPTETLDPRIGRHMVCGGAVTAAITPTTTVSYESVCSLDL